MLDQFNLDNTLIKEPLTTLDVLPISYPNVIGNMVYQQHLKKFSVVTVAIKRRYIMYYLTDKTCSRTNS